MRASPAQRPSARRMSTPSCAEIEIWLMSCEEVLPINRLWSGAGDGRNAGILKINRAERSGADWRDGRNPGDLLANDLRVLLREVGHPRGGCPGAKPGAGPKREQVVAQAGDLRLHGQRGALAERDHGDDGGDADEDAEHGEKRAGKVAPDFPHSDRKGIPDHRSVNGLRTEGDRIQSGRP